MKVSYIQIQTVGDEQEITIGLQHFSTTKSFSLLLLLTR